MLGVNNWAAKLSSPVVVVVVARVYIKFIIISHVYNKLCLYIKKLWYSVKCWLGKWYVSRLDDLNTYMLT